MIRVMVVSALVALTGLPSMAQAPQVPLFAFVSPDAAAAWQAVNDGVMGGVSDGRFRVTERQTMEFHGTLSLENKGGFASVRSRPGRLGLLARLAVAFGMISMGKATDSRAAAFVKRHGELVQVELDALPPDLLRQLYAEALAPYWDDAAYQRAVEREDDDRAVLLAS
jgi:hypothetical protein